MFQERVAYAVSTVMQAGHFICGRLKEEFEVFEKTSPADLVSDVDKQTEQFLVSLLSVKYPSDSFVTEEGTVASRFGTHCWIIDPIDGTLNFITQQKNYAISVAFYENGQPGFGIVYDVFENNLYLGIQGNGAYWNGEKIEVSPKRDLANSILDVNWKHKGRIHSLMNIDIEAICQTALNHRHLGSTTIRICDIAMGGAQVYISSKVEVWDYAAATIILRECGGEFQLFETEGDKHKEEAIQESAQKDEIQKKTTYGIVVAQSKELLAEVLSYSWKQ